MLARVPARLLQAGAVQFLRIFARGRMIVTDKGRVWGTSWQQSVVCQRSASCQLIPRLAGLNQVHPNMQLPVCMLTPLNSEIGIEVADRIVNPGGNIWLTFSVCLQISNVVSTQPSLRHHRMGARLQH